MNGKIKLKTNDKLSELTATPEGVSQVLERNGPEGGRSTSADDARAVHRFCSLAWGNSIN